MRDLCTGLPVLAGLHQLAFTGLFMSGETLLTCGLQKQSQHDQLRLYFVLPSHLQLSGCDSPLFMLDLASGTMTALR